MLERIADKISNRLIQDSVIDADDVMIYKYGVRQAVLYLIDIISVVVLGILFSRVADGIIIVAAFMCLRMYAGGYHASTSAGCYVLTLVIITAGLSVVKYFNVDILFCSLMIAVSGAVIFTLSPVETPNKPLDDVEKMIYRRKSICVWLIEAALAAAAALSGRLTLAADIMTAHVILAISLIIGKRLKQKNDILTEDNRV